MTDLLRTAVSWLMVLGGLAAVVLLLTALKHYLDLRQASFFILRQRTRKRLRGSLAALGLVVIVMSGISLSLRSWPEEEENALGATPLVSVTPVQAVNSASLPRGTQQAPSATPEPGDSPSPTVPFIPTYTPSPTSTPTVTPSLTPTPTQTPSVTPTPSITPTPSPTVPVLEAIYTPVVAFATPSADAEIGGLTVSSGVEINGVPVNPAEEYAVGQAALYVSFDYDGMADGLMWRQIWYRDGVLFGGGTLLWEWGPRGRTYFLLRPSEGFPAGVYEVEVLLEDEVVQRAAFTVSTP